MRSEIEAVHLMFLLPHRAFSMVRDDNPASPPFTGDAQILLKQAKQASPWMMLCGISVAFNSLGDVGWVDELPSPPIESPSGNPRPRYSSSRSGLRSSRARHARREQEAPDHRPLGMPARR